MQQITNSKYGTLGLLFAIAGTAFAIFGLEDSAYWIPTMTAAASWALGLLVPMLAVSDPSQKRCDLLLRAKSLPDF